ncbi:hypothetical protein, partial [Tateyamaria pelophila]|uniref:hypothetical protein n=1 Tax=Tateyamaria pelophila TaxID=328415 RepID=UPI001CBEAB23
SCLIAPLASSRPLFGRNESQTYALKQELMGVLPNHQMAPALHLPLLVMRHAPLSGKFMAGPGRVAQINCNSERALRTPYL